MSNRQSRFFLCDYDLIKKGHMARMGAINFAVYSVMQCHAESRLCSVSYSRIQKLTGISRPTTAKAITQLLELRYLCKVPCEGQSNVYKILDLPLIEG